MKDIHTKINALLKEASQPESNVVKMIRGLPKAEELVMSGFFASTKSKAESFRNEIFPDILKKEVGLVLYIVRECVKNLTVIYRTAYIDTVTMINQKLDEYGSSKRIDPEIIDSLFDGVIRNIISVVKTHASLGHKRRYEDVKTQPIKKEGISGLKALLQEDGMLEYIIGPAIETARSQAVAVLGAKKNARQ